MQKRESIGIVGSGAWGTAIAIQMCKNFEVDLYAVETSVYTELQNFRTNEKALPNINIPNSINIKK